MNRKLLLIAVVVIVASAVLIANPRLVISGYDGINASIYRVYHRYDSVSMTPTGMTSLTLDPNPYWVGNLNIDPTGIHIDMQIPNIIDERDLDPIVKVTNKSWIDPDTGDKMIETTTETVRVRIINMEFTVHVFTVPDGLAAITDVQIYIRLTENGQSVFSNPDEAEAYILNVYTTAETEIARAADVAPLAGGIDLTMITIRLGNVPSWITDSGYTGQLTNFKDVAILLEIFRMIPDSLIVRGAEAEAVFHLGFDVILFGYWEEVKTTREFEREFETYWWEDILNNLDDLWKAILTPIGMILVMVAIIGTVLILIKAPTVWLKLFGTVAIWVAVLFILFMFGVVELG